MRNGNTPPGNSTALSGNKGIFILSVTSMLLYLNEKLIQPVGHRNLYLSVAQINKIPSF
ncbi:MAG: hypothetical protein OEW99_11565 [Gammaproteobacteria bacterium]|nr:hypothetical protein [Gammaproteobacteria bacterium]